MNLIEVYIHEVIRRLPGKGRSDIELELRSTIEDMLPEQYGEKDVKVVLEQLGNPATLASGYRDQPMHLIGPRYYDVYVSLLKMILPIAAIVSLIALIAEYFVGFPGEEAPLNIIIDIFSFGLAKIIEVGIQVFFWLTFSFAILERIDKGKNQQPLTASLKEWTPEDLKNIPFIPEEKTVSKWEVFGSFMWTAIWATLYFYANHLVGIYRNNGDGLEFVAPAFNSDVLLQYWPLIIAVTALEIGLALYKLIKGQWTRKMAIFNTAVDLIATVVFIVIISNPNLMNLEFITYMSDVFDTTAKQFETVIVGGGIIIFIISAAINVFSGFRKSKI